MRRWTSRRFVVFVVGIVGIWLLSIQFNLNYNLTNTVLPRAKLPENERTAPPLTPAPKPSTRGVIVYLAQFGTHSSYGKQNLQGNAKLQKSLDSLYQHYNNQFHDDVIVFYAKEDLDPEFAWEMKRGRPSLEFRNLSGSDWELPQTLRGGGSPLKRGWLRPNFSVGYRHMNRWYAVLIWPYLKNLGYTHVMRMDDDSYLHSHIPFNFFDFMVLNDFKYAYRTVIRDTVALGLYPIVESYLKLHNMQPKDPYYNASINLGFYNNFFVAEIDAWIQPPVADVLLTIDFSNIMYTHRVGDLIIQSVLARVFLKPAQLYRFKEFTYEHVTNNPSTRCLQNGAIFKGTQDSKDNFAQLCKSLAKRYPKTCNKKDVHVDASAFCGRQKEGANDLFDSVKYLNLQKRNPIYPPLRPRSGLSSFESG